MDTKKYGEKELLKSAISDIDKVRGKIMKSKISKGLKVELGAPLFVVSIQLRELLKMKKGVSK